MCFMLIDMFTNIRTTHVKQTLHKPCKTCLDTETQYITFFAVFFASFSCTEVLGTKHEDCQALCNAQCNALNLLSLSDNYQTL